MIKKKSQEMNNIVRIGGRENREKYDSSILMRMKPSVYNKPEHKCIKIQVMAILLEFADYIINRWKFAGLKEVSRKKTPIKNEQKGYTLNDAYEITLKKIPVLEMMEEEDG